MSNFIKYSGVLSIDPSIKACGIAIFLKNKLVYTDVVRTMAVVNSVQAIREIVEKIQKAWDENVGATRSPELIVIEKPQIYQQQLLKGDPNDLVPLAILGGVIWEKFQPRNIMFPLPREWKGQVPKAVMTKKTLANLDKSELYALQNDLIRTPETLRHNAYDAIGIGQWGIERTLKLKDITNAVIARTI